MTDAMQARAKKPQDYCAQVAATKPRVVRSVAELQMALQGKARGQRISQLRKRTPGLTQQALSAKLGVGYRTVQTWEAGEVVPEWHNIQKMAKHFKVRPEDILGDTPPLKPAQLDRVESKLDAIMAHMGVSPSVAPEDDELGQALAADVPPADKQSGSSKRASRARRAEGP